MNYRVYLKAGPNSRWYFSGVVESSRDVANHVWPDIIKRLRYHSYKLEWTDSCIPIER